MASDASGPVCRAGAGVGRRRASRRVVAVCSGRSAASDTAGPDERAHRPPAGMPKRRRHRLPAWRLRARRAARPSSRRRTHPRRPRATGRSLRFGTALPAAEADWLADAAGGGSSRPWASGQEQIATVLATRLPSTAGSESPWWTSVRRGHMLRRSLGVYFVRSARSAVASGAAARRRSPSSLGRPVGGGAFVRWSRCSKWGPPCWEPASAPS